MSLHAVIHLAQNCLERESIIARALHEMLLVLFFDVAHWAERGANRGALVHVLSEGEPLVGLGYSERSFAGPHFLLGNCFPVDFPSRFGTPVVFPGQIA